MGVLDPVLHGVDRFQQRHRWTAFPVRGGQEVRRRPREPPRRADHVLRAASSIFPLLLVFVTVLGFVLEGDAGLRRDLTDSALADFPVIGTQLRRNVQALSGQGLGFAIGMFVLVWGSLGVAQAAQHATAEVWNIPGRARPGSFPGSVAPSSCW